MRLNFRFAVGRGFGGWRERRLNCVSRRWREKRISSVFVRHQQESGSAVQCAACRAAHLPDRCAAGGCDGEISPGAGLNGDHLWKCFVQRLTMPSFCIADRFWMTASSPFGPCDTRATRGDASDCPHSIADISPASICSSARYMAVHFRIGSLGAGMLPKPRQVLPGCVPTFDPAAKHATPQIRVHHAMQRLIRARRLAHTTVFRKKHVCWIT